MLNGQALELQSVVQDIQCNSTGRRLSGSLNPCPSASVTQVGLEHLQFLHDCTDKLHDEACIAHCGFGFDMQEVFEGTAPSCEPITCSDLELGERFYHNCQSKRFGETCGVSCATGYHLQGPELGIDPASELETADADDLGSNITAQLDAASVFTLQQLIVDGMMNVSEAKAVVTCDEQGWQLQDECPPESYLLVCYLFLLELMAMVEVLDRERQPCFIRYKGHYKRDKANDLERDNLEN
ncbi:unnamed protein product [Durusdinium trenchii]|uniref:Uncharacterized protein n=1 Tax=Durusdinium trenchii TaxID=1381693 RepID=A0ABP0N3H3_9DINO